MASRVILLVGCSGSGKSTYAREHFPEAVIVSADHYFEELATATSQSFEDVWDLWRLGAAHSQCQQRFLEAITNNAPIVVVDNTNVRATDRQRYIKKASTFGLEVELHVLSAWHYGKAALTGRQITRYVNLCHKRNAHGVPREVVAQQFERLELPSGIYLAGKPAQFLRPLPGHGA